MKIQQPSRRRFLIQAAVAATALPLLASLARSPAEAQALKKLTADNAQAKALGYVDDASKSSNAAHKAGSLCSNCQFFTASTGACALFAGYSVNSKGWCSAWAKKA
ncbi:MAG TPA: high-potential iron-sulfur protein [Arenimonas sp.]|uniref:high-potential iron-sulfur protein n=1 Tax=Arenimonas sp. TaxID=1872635 RepID=UPI002BF0B9C8|nr:high-potential iron-sulfur protein [Arenimonas sp.]HMB56121.1 high-potential iron-sulfur protein [Arenimonas sp.]